MTDPTKNLPWRAARRESGIWCVEDSTGKVFFAAPSEALARMVAAGGEVPSLKAENERLKRDNGFAERIMEAIRKHSEGDREALAGMGVPWVDSLLAERDAMRRVAGELYAALREAIEYVRADVDDVVKAYSGDQEAHNECEYVAATLRRLQTALAKAAPLLEPKESP